MITLRFARLALALLLATGVLFGGATAAFAQTQTEQYTLPGSNVYPEGVAFDRKTGFYYVSSTGNGAIFRGHVAEEEAEVFLAGGGDGRTFVAGVEVWNGLLFAAGGATGQMFVYSTDDGELVAKLGNGRAADATFINDVAVTRTGEAYFTESHASNPVLYRLVPDGDTYRLEEWLNFSGTPLQYTTGFNLNGIEATHDGRYLIVVQSNTGKLFRITIDTKEVVEIDTGGTALTAGDGLLLRGHRLYVARNMLHTIVELRLSGNYTSARFISALQNPQRTFLKFPTTLAQARGRMLVVNSQFDRQGPTAPAPDMPFTLTSIRFP